MPLLEVCHHLEVIADRLTGIHPGDSYRVGRICQNLRLDFPGFHDNAAGTFLDRKSYPVDYPLQRGANVPVPRQDLFVAKATGDLALLKQHASRAKNGSDQDVEEATADYFKQLEDLWAGDDFLTLCAPCNADNRTPLTEVPAKLCRYMDLRSFVAYSLLPNVDATKWDRPAVSKLLRGLLDEQAAPGPAWLELSALWREARSRIRSGSLEFSVTPRFHRGDVKFVGDGGVPVHLASPHPIGSRESLHYVIQELALPTWEEQKDRERKFGLVAIEAPSTGWAIYRPTILDNIGYYSYFFLPGNRKKISGMTWKLTDCLRFNSTISHEGQVEWTIMVPPTGISCVSTVHGKLKPSFDLVGLEFGLEHALLLAD